MIQFFLRNWHNMVLATILLGAAIAISLVAHFLLFWVLRRFARLGGAVLDQSLIRHGKRPSRDLSVAGGACCIARASFAADLNGSTRTYHWAGVDCCCWLVRLSIDVIADMLADRYRIDIADNLVARRIQTQFQMLRRITAVLVAIVTLSVMLMTFPAIRHIGMNLLASAGLTTPVVGRP